MKLKRERLRRLDAGALGAARGGHPANGSAVPIPVTADCCTSSQACPLPGGGPSPAPSIGCATQTTQQN
jgi:hypothetical protein